MPTEFADLFKKQRAPKDYVSFPPQETPSLEKFFAERTPKPAVKEEPYNMFGREFLKKDSGKPTPKTVAKPVDDKIKALSESSPKVTPEKLAEIKSIFSSNPAPGGADVGPQQAGISEEEYASQQAPQVAAPTASSEYEFDGQKVKRQVAEMAPQASWMDIALGAVPMIASSLAGGHGEGVNIAGKYLTDKASSLEKRKMSLEDKLMDIEKARTIASAKGSGKNGSGTKRFVSKPVWHKGLQRSVYANYDTFTGSYSLPNGKALNDEDIEVGFSTTPDEFNRRTEINQENKKEAADYTPRTDTETGLWSRATPEGMQPIGPQKGRLDPNQEKSLKGITDRFIGSDAYKKPVGTLSAVANIDELLRLANDTSNSAAAQFARKELAKMAEGGSRLSDMDVEMVSGSPSIKARVARFTNLQKTNVPLSPKDIEELQEVAEVLEDDARRKLNDSMSGMENDYIANSRGVRGAVGDKMKAYIPSQVERKGRTVRVRNLVTGDEGKIPREKLDAALKSKKFKRL